MKQRTRKEVEQMDEKELRVLAGIVARQMGYHSLRDFLISRMRQLIFSSMTPKVKSK